MAEVFARVEQQIFADAVEDDDRVVLLIGTAAGTYSSIAVASQLLVLWQDGTLPRLLRLGSHRRAVRTRRA